MEAAGSNPAPSTILPPRTFLGELKKQGYADQTLEGYEKRLRFLEANTDINNPENVKTLIANHPTWSNAYRESMVNAYLHYVELNNLQWEKPKYSRPARLPNIPQTEQVNKIIAASGKKYSIIFAILRDTGLRPIELHRTTSKNYDLTTGLISPD